MAVSLLPPMRNEEWFTHPANKEAIETALNAANKDLERDIFNPLSVYLSWSRIPITFDPSLPIRDVESKWHPPSVDRFTEYGPEDEAWMRPLGLGRIEHIDKGPLIVKLSRSGFFRTFNDYPVLNPHCFIKTCS